jgi:hypothetical protein
MRFISSPVSFPEGTPERAAAATLHQRFGALALDQEVPWTANDSGLQIAAGHLSGMPLRLCVVTLPDDVFFMQLGDRSHRMPGTVSRHDVAYKVPGDTPYGTREMIAIGAILDDAVFSPDLSRTMAAGADVKLIERQLLEPGTE